MFQKLSLTVATFLMVFGMLGFVNISNISAEETPSYTLKSSFTLELEDVSKKDLFNLVSDPMNDHQWYPGVINTELIQKGPRRKAPVGNKYLQTIDIGIGTPVYLNLEIVEYVKNKKVVLKGEGLQSFVATYTFSESCGKSKFTLSSTLTAPFIDVAGLQGLLTLAHTNIANIFGAEFTSVMDYAEFI